MEQNKNKKQLIQDRPSHRDARERCASFFSPPISYPRRQRRQPFLVTCEVFCLGRPSRAGLIEQASHDGEKQDACPVKETARYNQGGGLSIQEKLGS